MNQDYTESSRWDVVLGTGLVNGEHASSQAAGMKEHHGSRAVVWIPCCMQLHHRDARIHFLVQRLIRFGDAWFHFTGGKEMCQEARKY
jgi:hypothetical protein